MAAGDVDVLLEALGPGRYGGITDVTAVREAEEIVRWQSQRMEASRGRQQFG